MKPVEPAKIEKILVPLDFTECSWAALRHGVFLASRFAADLKLLHVWRVPWYFDDQARVISRSGKEQRIEELARDKAWSEILRFVWTVERESDVKVGAVVVPGTPRNVILETAELNYDLIVMGPHGRTGLSHLFLGSATEGVVRRASCPVLTVRNVPGDVPTSFPSGTGRGGKQSMFDNLRLKKIFVPVDFSECSSRALSYAAQLANAFEAHVDVVHVVEPPRTSSPLMPCRLGAEESLIDVAVRQSREKLEEITAPLRERGVALRSAVKLGYPPDQLLAAIEDERYDMVVVGTHGRKGISHFFLGSVAEQLVRRAPCPVLTLRAAGESSSDVA